MLYICDYRERACLTTIGSFVKNDCYQVSLPFHPYFYVAVEPGTEKEVMPYFQKKFSKIMALEQLKKEDLDLVCVIMQ